MTKCDAVKTQNHGRDNGRRIGRAAVGLVSRQPKGLRAAPVVLLTAIILVSPAQAQPPTQAPVCATGRDLIEIPEVKSENGKLRAVLMLSDEYRAMSDRDRCLWQHLRYFKGWNAAADPPPAWPSNQEPLPKGKFPGEPIPGPTLRARIGDLIEISFLNQIDTKNFPFSLDLGEGGFTPTGCDEATGTAQVPVDPEKPDGPKKTIKVEIYPRNDTMPNCLHGSSTANIHFHGTHTTPSTTGDNVLLYIRPALRVRGQIEPTDAVVKREFDKIFKSCEEKGSPTRWEDLEEEWRNEQKRLLETYDKTAPYKGIPGNLPAGMKLWPRNEGAIKKGLWPQYFVGAFPYCFRLPDYEDYKQYKVKMAQAPGTHWYHAHKHGSTALNVGNGMIGAFIIEGPYDDTLRAFYNGKLEEKVLVIQQLAVSLNMLSPLPFAGTALLSVNGRREPVITMRPGQVQLWRIVNGAPRSFVQFLNFDPPGVEWRQTAQDGVQFHPDNYDNVGKVNAQFNMAAANRVDVLIKAPQKVGSYELKVRESVIANPRKGDEDRDSTLLKVNVTGEAIDPPMEFIDKGNFPPFPDFLKDIPASEAYPKRELVFDSKPGPTRKSLTSPGNVLPLHKIDDKLFAIHIVSQTMGVNTVEEWTMVNKAVGIAHPFHIHINPFQVVEVFDPNSAEANKVGGDCYADPMKPETWKPETRKPSCTALPAPFVWWDVLAIPSARADKFNCGECPSSVGDACSFDKNTKQCTVTIPGYFKMRSRFVDFQGLFVQHCHILAHEDRGMMQLIQVAPKRIDGPVESGYEHD